MKLQIKRIDRSLPLPTYHTKGACGFDIYSRENAHLQPKEIKRVPTNLIIKVPEGYTLMIAARSSLAQKHGLQLANSVGIIDNDFCGEQDEIQLTLRNLKDEPVTIERGERIAQGLILPIEKVKWEEVEQINSPDRGGFGSTG